MAPMPEPLFHRRSLRAVLDARLLEAEHTARNITETDLDSRSDEVITAAILGHSHIDVPRLTPEAASFEAKEAQIDIAPSYAERWIRDADGPVMAQGTRVTFFVPFEGNPHVFELEPSATDGIWPRANVEGQELQFMFEKRNDRIEEAKGEFEEELGRVQRWLGRAAQEIEEYHNALPAKITAALTVRRREVAQRRHGLEALGMPQRGVNVPIQPTPRTSSPIPAPEPAPHAAALPEKYDVALSFAGEQRKYVEVVAKGLRDAGVKVFYDEFETAKLWGKDLAAYFTDVFQHRARFVVMFASSEYMRKAWPGHERRSAQGRQLIQGDDYILPVRFDETEVPGLPATIGWVDARILKPLELVALIRAKLEK